MRCAGERRGGDRVWGGLGMAGPLAEGGFEVEETVLAGGREVMDEAGLFEVI